jgi:glycosyltransferase involved in cell wall biosynthesis
MRVVLLHNYRDEQQPSMRLYAEHLGQALRRQGVAVTRVRPPPVVPEAWRARSPTWGKIDGYLGRFAVYPRLVRTLEADVIHVVDHGQGYLLANLDGHRTVVTCHDVILLALAHGRIGSSAVPPIALELFRISMELMKRASAIVAVSEQTKRDLTGFVGIPGDRVRVIPPGLSQRFAPDPERGKMARRRLGLDEDTQLVLHIGRTFYKNIPGVLRVLHRLRAGGLNVKLLRTGRPLAGDERVLARRLGVDPAIIELYSIADADLPSLYNAADLLLFPSLYEGFGWPPLEAMASGTPVVCSRAGSLGEVVGAAALTADPEDVDTLAWHAASVLTNRALREALVQRGLAHAAQFRWERTAAAMIDVYRSIASNGVS